TIIELTNQLIKLPQLAELSIHMFEIDFSLQLATLDSIPSVKILRISRVFFKGFWDLNRFLSIISTIFPNTEEFSIDKEYELNGGPRFEMESLKRYFTKLLVFHEFTGDRLDESPQPYMGRHSGQYTGAVPYDRWRNVLKAIDAL